MKLSFTNRLLIGTFRGINRLRAWHRLPKWLSVINLMAFREELRAKNLHDVYPSVDAQGIPAKCPMHDSRYMAVRHSDGLFNDLQQPLMGCTGMRMGRNGRLADAQSAGDQRTAHGPPGRRIQACYHR